MFFLYNMGTESQNKKFTTIDIATLKGMIGIIEDIYPMVKSKNWNVNKMVGAQKFIVGTAVELVENNPYTLDVLGHMRTAGDTLFWGDVSMNKTLYVKQANLNNASITNLYVDNLKINITDLYIKQNLYVYNNVSINGDLYNFSNTFLNYLNVSNETTFQNSVTVNGSTNLNGITNLNSSTNLNGIIYLNNNLFNTNNTIFCTSSLTPIYHNYTENTTLIDIDGLGFIDNLITTNISSTTIKSSVYTSISDSLGCSITNVLNLSILNNTNVSAKVSIGNVDNPVKLDITAVQDQSGINYKGNVFINKKNDRFDVIESNIEMNGINSSLNINGNIQINTVMDDTNKFYLQGNGKILFDGVTYLNTLDVGYNATAKTNSQFNSNYTLNVKGNTNVSGNMNVTNNLLIGGSITHFSDYKLKTNITKLESSLNKIQNINGYTYNRIDLNDNKTYLGLIAQEVEKEYPDIIEYTDDIRSINYQSFTAILIESIKELNIKVMELEKRINNL
jgi:hypothetical protein